jgi:hypothetical protein
VLQESTFTQQAIPIMVVKHAQLEHRKVVELHVLGEVHALASVHLALQALSHLPQVGVLAKVAQ